MKSAFFRTAVLLAAGTLTAVPALVRDPAMRGVDIGVSVEQGRVTLDGRAKSPPQAEKAKQAAENVAGSGKVTSKLAASG